MARARAKMSDVTTPPPSDADRIIAAQAEQAAKTRRLLVWIFVGVPLLGGLAALLIWAGVTSSHQPGTAPFPAVVETTTDTYAATGGPAPTDTTVVGSCVYIDGQPDAFDAYCAATNRSTTALNNPGALTSTSTCLDLTSQQNTTIALDGVIGPPFNATVGRDLLAECRTHPQELLIYALPNAQAAAGTPR